MAKSMVEERVTPYINELGQEVLSDVAMELPAGLCRPPSLIEQMRMMVRQEFSRHAAAQGFESFEESDDFNVEDEWDLEPTSAYEDEAVFEPEVKRESAKDGSDSERVGVGSNGTEVDVSPGGGSGPVGGSGELGGSGEPGGGA